jgi:hypothetical protein
MLGFNLQKEKEAYKQARKEIPGPNWIASTLKTSPVYDMPLVYDHTIPERPVKKVNTLK